DVFRRPLAYRSAGQLLQVKPWVVDASADGQREVDVTVSVLHERSDHAERQADSRLRLVGSAGPGELQAAQQDVGFSLQIVAVDPTLDVGGQPPVARFPRHHVQQIRIRPRPGELAQLALEIESQWAGDGTDRAGKAHQTVGDARPHLHPGG